MLPGSTPARSRLTYRSTSTRVLPVPADASRTTFCAGSTAARRDAASDGSERIGAGPDKVRPTPAAGNQSEVGRTVSGPPSPLSSSKGKRRSDVTDVVPSAHRRVRARLAAKHIIRCRRKLAGVDRVDRLHQTLLSVRQNLRSLGARREQRHHPLGAFEGEVGRLTKNPAPSQMPREALFRADRVDRQLQRARSVGGPAKLVVD